MRVRPASPFLAAGLLEEIPHDLPVPGRGRWSDRARAMAVVQPHEGGVEEAARPLPGAWRAATRPTGRRRAAQRPGARRSGVLRLQLPAEDANRSSASSQAR